MEKKQTKTSEAFLNKIKAGGVSIIDGSSFDRFEDKNIINSDIPFGGDMREYGHALDNIYGDFERFYSQGKKPPEKDFDTGRKIHETFQEAVEMQFPKKDGGHYTEAEMTEWETVFERYGKEGHVPDPNNYGFNHFDAEVGSKKVLAQIMELQTGEPYVLAELKGVNQGEEVIAVIPENLYSDGYVKSLETEYLNFNGAERGTEKAVEGYGSAHMRYEIISDIMANNNCRIEFGASNGDMAEAFIAGNADNNEILRFSYDEKSDVDFAQKLIEKANSLSLLDGPHTELVRKIAKEIAKEYEKELFQENEKIIPARSDDGNVSEYDFRDKIEDAIISDKKIGKKYRAAFDLDEKLNIHGLDDLRVEMLQTLVEVVGNGERNVSKEEVVNIADGMLNSGGYVEKARKAKQWEFAEKEEFVDPVRVMAMDTLGLDAAIEVFGTVDKPKEVSYELQEELRSLSSSLRLQGVGAKSTLQDIEKIKELAGLSENTPAHYVDEFHLTKQNFVTPIETADTRHNGTDGEQETTLREYAISKKTKESAEKKPFTNLHSFSVGEQKIILDRKFNTVTKRLSGTTDERMRNNGFSYDEKENVWTSELNMDSASFALAMKDELHKANLRDSNEEEILMEYPASRRLYEDGWLWSRFDDGSGGLHNYGKRNYGASYDSTTREGWLTDENGENDFIYIRNGYEDDWNTEEFMKMAEESIEKHYGLHRQEEFSRWFYDNGQDENIVKEKIMESQNAENITLALDAFKNGYQAPKHDGLDEYSEKTLVRNRGWKVNASKADYETGEPLNVEICYDGYLVAEIDLKANEFKFAVTKSIYYGDEIREATLLAAKEIYPKIHYFGQEQPIVIAEEADRMTISELKAEIQKNNDFELEIDGDEAHLKYVELDDEGNPITRLDENGERVSRMYGLENFRFENPQDFIDKLERVSDNFDTWNCQKNYVPLLLEEEGSSAKKEVETAIAEFEKDGATKERIANATKAAQQDLDKQSLDYTVVKVMPKYTHPDDSHLFMCVAKRNSDGKYAAWSSLNVNGERGSLENGHHDLETEEDACKVLLNFADENVWEKANPKILKLNEKGAKVAETLRENLSEMVNDVCDFYYDPQNSLERYLRKNPNEENRQQLTEEEFATVDRIIEATGSYWAIPLTDKNENPFVYDRENEEIQEFKNAIKDLYDAAEPLFRDDEFAPSAYGLEENDEKVLDGIMEKFGVVPTEKQIEKGIGKINSILGENFTSKDFGDFALEQNWNDSDDNLTQQQLQSFLAEKLTSAAYPNGLDANAIEGDSGDVEITKENIAKMSEKLLDGEYSFSKEQAIEKIKDVAIRKPQDWLYDASIITDGISSSNIYQEPFDWLPVSNGFRELAGKLRNLERSLDYGEDFSDFANADFPKKNGEKYSEEELEKFKQIARSYRDMYAADQYPEIMMEIAQIQTGEKYMLVDIHGETKDDIIAKLLMRESEYSEEFRKNVEIEFMNNGHSSPSQNATVESYVETVNDYLKNNFSDFELENEPGHFEVVVDAPDEEITEEEIALIENSLSPQGELANVFDNHYDENIDDRWDDITSKISNEISEKHGVEIAPEAVAEYLKDNEILNIVYDGKDFLREQSPEALMRLADAGIPLSDMGMTSEELAELNTESFTWRDKELLEKVAKVFDVAPESLAADIADAESAAREFYGGSYAEENGHSFKEYAASQLAVMGVEKEFSLEESFDDAGIELEKIGLKIATGKIENHSQLAEEIEGVEKMLQEEKALENETKLSAAEIAEKINRQEFYEYDVIDENDAEQFVKIAEHIGHEFKGRGSLYDDFKKSLNDKILRGEADELLPFVNELAKMHDNAKNLARRIVSGQNPNLNTEHLDEGQIQELENELELNYVPYEFKTEKCLEFAEMKKLLEEKHEVTFGEIENRNAGDANKEPDYYLNMQFYSDLGEDFNTTIELGDTISPESLADGISDAYESFNVDEHAEMWIEAKNNYVRGVPKSISNLVEDAKSIDQKLKNIDKDAERLNWQHSNGRTMALEEPKKETPSVNATPFERVAENVKKTLAKDGNDINAMSTTTIMTAFAKSIQALSQKDKEMFSRQLIEMGGISKGAVEKLILKAAGKEITKENKKLRDDYGIGR